MIGRAGPAEVTRAGISVSRTSPSELGPDVWSRLAGPWEIDYSFANSRATEEFPFNDSSGQGTFWWLVRRGDAVLGAYPGYVTETLNLAALFTVGFTRLLAGAGEPVYLALNRARFYHRLPGPVRRLVRLMSGRTRVMFLGAHLADVGGHGIGEGLREAPEDWLPALHAMIDGESRRLRVEQVSFRETAERDVGPFRFPDLWSAEDGGGRLLERFGFGRDPGLPAAYLDLRQAQADLPTTETTLYGFFRHRSMEAFLDYEAARQRWLADARAWLDDHPGERLADAVVRGHPRADVHPDAARLTAIRDHLFRSGQDPAALAALTALDRGEAAARSAELLDGAIERAAAEVERLAGAQAEAVAELPAGIALDVVVRARRVPALVDRLAARPETDPGPTTAAPSNGSVTAEAPVQWAASMRELAALAEEVRRLEGEIDPRFRSLRRDLQRTLLALAHASATDAPAEGAPADRNRLTRQALWPLGSRPDLSAEEQEAIRARLAELVAVAATEATRDGALRAARVRIEVLRRDSGVSPDDAPDWLPALDLLERHGGALPAALADLAARAEVVEGDLQQARETLTRRTSRQARAFETARDALLGSAGESVSTREASAMRAEFRREQDRVAARWLGRPAEGPEARQLGLEQALRYRRLDYARLLVRLDTLRDEDCERMARNHAAHRDRVLADHPDQPGPDAPRFDQDGYLADSLLFEPRDERVWTNLADQDRITDLYHRVMAKSHLRHEVVDWPYYAAYRHAGHESNDELHVATLRAGGRAGPIVAAQSVKRSRAGHVRPERIGLSGVDFGAYHTLIVMTLAYEFAHGATFVSLGQTSQGVKLRDLGMSFTDAHEYTRFQGLGARLLGFDLARRRAFDRIDLDQLLEVAALPPEERAGEAKRHGIRWRV